MVALVQIPGVVDGQPEGKERSLPLPVNPRTGGIPIRSDYSYMNDDVFSLASILNLKETCGRLRVTFTANVRFSSEFLRIENN